MRWSLLPLAGLVLALGFPNELPGAVGDRPSFLVAWIALAPLWWALLTLPARKAHGALWWFGAAFYLGTLAWVRLFGILPWIGLSLAMALTPLAALWLAQRVRLAPALLPLTFALAFTGVEWLRGHGQFGLAWSELGASQVDGPLAVIAALGGVPLITFLLLWVSGGVVQRLCDRTAPRWMLPAGLAALGICLLVGHLQVRATMDRWCEQTDGLRVGVVQPNVLRGLTPEALHTGISEVESRNRFRQLMALSYQAARAPGDAPGHATLVVWPESALRDIPDEPEIANFCFSTNSYLLAGAPSYPSDAGDGFANSAYLLDPRGATREIYSKIHLVPFGEFVPLPPRLRRYVVEQYGARDTDLIAGHTRDVLRSTGVPFGVGICFESTFADIAREYARQGARLLVYTTNDAWFHQTGAVRQHFTHARFRALETGLPVARAASTGISGFITPDGGILEAIPTYTAGTRTRFLPAGTPGTPNTAGGWRFGPACLLAVLLLAGYRPRRKSSETATTHVRS